VHRNIKRQVIAVVATAPVRLHDLLETALLKTNNNNKTHEQGVQLPHSRNAFLSHKEKNERNVLQRHRR
jgi:hypothetical protein